MFKCKFCECAVLSMNMWLIDKAYHQDIDAICTAAHSLIDILVDEYNSENRLMYYIVDICIDSSHVNINFYSSSTDTTVDNGIENISYIYRLFHDYNIYQNRNNKIYRMNNTCFNEAHTGNVRNFKDIMGDKNSMHDIVSSLKSHSPMVQTPV